MHWFSKIIRKNIFIYDFLLKIRFRKRNKELLSFTDAISRIDPIMHYADFVEAMRKTPKRSKDIYALKRAYGESFLYGHGGELMDYSGYPRNKKIFIPIIEHGILYSDFDPTRYKIHNSYIFQGKSNYSDWKKTQKSKPYYIGPYIHYCDYCYDNTTISKLKKKNGKTLLLFLPHSIETKQFSIDLQNILSGLKGRFEKIDTILACVYCMDCLDLPKISDKRIRLVSAGFKLDPLFISRLKTIIELSDIVYYTSFSSSIGYAYYLGKTIVCNPNERDYKQVQDEIGETACAKLKSFHRLFGLDSNSSDSAKREFVNELWGLDEIKTKEEILNILKENERRIKCRLGFLW